MACTLAESPSDPLHRKLRQLRCLRRRFDCYRVERTSSRAGVAPAEVQRLSRRTFSPTDRCVVSNVGVNRASRLILGTGGVIAFIAVFLISRPHVSRSSLQLFAASCPCPTFHEQVTGLIVLNPLRNRAPEKAATQFLSDLRKGKCNAEERTVPWLCKDALERRPVLDLRLRNRKGVGNTVMLFYLF